MMEIYHKKDWKIALIVILQIIMKFMSKSYSFALKNCNSEIPNKIYFKEVDLN